MDSLFDDAPQKAYVDELNVGDLVESAFVVHRLNLREYDKGKFLQVRLGDRTGKVNAVLWNNADSVNERLEEGQIVHIEGKVNSYQGELQITLDRIEALQDLSEVDPGDFLPKSPYELDEMTAEFDQRIEEIQDTDFRELLESFRNDEAVWKKFSTAPGAKLWHHPYIHGLLEHTLSVIRMCRAAADNYPNINRDLLITGAVFHDSGKMDEFEYDFRIDYSTQGRLLTHVYMSTKLAEQLIERLEAFPEEKRRLLLHIILSHHGETERSPVLPMTLEACLLHHVENMDAQIAAFQREMDKVGNESKPWTGYVNLIGRYLYRGEPQAPDDEEAAS
ncbi:MAG: OB-fold nucleic acid binding domain-containing protein [Candidatus Hinthialibacter antarcticus]|nr:OB-fold nucleic acid binding domain-containing protein [Candidatus Hinthialibacter antarcticus]